MIRCGKPSPLGLETIAASILISWLEAGAAPLAMEEALGFDSPSGRPSGTMSTVLQKVRKPLAHARTCPFADASPTYSQRMCPPLLQAFLSRCPFEPLVQLDDYFFTAFGVVPRTACGGRLAG